MRYRNSSIHARVWPHLTNAETGRTLHLEPGEDAEVKVPDGTTPAFLEPVPAVVEAAPTVETVTPSCDPEPAPQETTPKRRVKE